MSSKPVLQFQLRCYFGFLLDSPGHPNPTCAAGVCLPPSLDLNLILIPGAIDLHDSTRLVRPSPLPPVYISIHVSALPSSPQVPGSYPVLPSHLKPSSQSSKFPDIVLVSLRFHKKISPILGGLRIFTPPLCMWRVWCLCTSPIDQ
jgi:hypothetical protein